MSPLHDTRTVAWVCILLTTSFLHTAVAATRYVEVWGANINPQCPKTLPCKDIQFAINQSGPNDRIRVGPGDHFGSLLIPAGKEGLKLESTAGRFATVIKSALHDTGLTIQSAKVSVGGKGKGFTFQGPEVPLGDLPVTTGHGVYASAERQRIIGNRFLWHEIGALVEGGSRSTVSNNIALLNKFTGIQCTGCERAIIQDNRAEFNGGNGIHVGSDSHRITIRRNVASDNDNHGISKSNLLPENFRATDNVAERNDADGFRMPVARSLFQGNIATGNSGDGAALDGRQNTPEGDARIRHNIAVLNSADGFTLTDPETATIENNFSAENGPYGFSLAGGITNGPPRFRNNTSFDHNCGIRNTALTEFLYTGQYFAANTTDECGTETFDTRSSTRQTPAPVMVNRARGLVGG